MLGAPVHNHLSIISLNISGQRHALRALRELRPRADIIILTETWLMRDVPAADFTLPGFVAHHCCRLGTGGAGRPHGGVSVFVRKALAPEFSSDASHGIVWLKLPALRQACAACYFSPAGSALYAANHLHPEPFQVLQAGLALLEGQGYRTAIVGDLNARVGRAPDLPSAESLELEALLACPTTGDVATCAAIPPRASTDATLAPFGQLLLDLLIATSMVLCNGRTRGDPLGAATCRHTGIASANAGQGGSVVDIAAVQAGDFARVVDFTVLGALPECPQHLPVHLLLRAEQACAANPVTARASRVRVLRPTAGPMAAAYTAALRGDDAQAQLGDIVRTLPVVGAEQAVQRLSDLIITAAASVCPRSRSSHSARPSDAPPARPAGAPQACPPGAPPTRQGGVKHVRRGSPRRAASRSAPPTRAGGPPPLRGRGGAPWWDDECSRARDAFYNIFNNSSDRDEVVAARGVYRRLQNHKRALHRQQQQIELIKTYFSREPRDFWRAFRGGPAPPGPLQDVGEWTHHFDHILNTGTAEREPPPAEDSALKHSLRPAAAGPSANLAGISAPFTEKEVRTAVATLRCNKAADAFGITAECLKHARWREEGERTHQYVLVPTLTAIINRIFEHPSEYPHQFRVNTLTPIYKGKGSDRDMNCYRGIAVGSALGKVFERLLYARANAAAESSRLRAPTQFGFRQEHGTLDGMFVLRHLIDRARHDKQILYCLFVDFEKAFDTVPRAEMLARCRRLGMHGKFLDAVAAMYESILMAVKLQASVGPTFPTTQGTKQGGELSPLLFGLFIEQLHELLVNRCPGMGPLVGGMHVPDLMYADDVACLAHDPAHIQRMLDALHLFCDLFGMRVNLSKTFIVMYRKGSYLPVAARDTVWYYAGQPVPTRKDFKYLGATFHCTKGMRVAADVMAASGRRAMHALLTRLKAAGISQWAFSKRLFGVLVEPVLSYGCQVWGPDMLGKGLDRNATLSNAQERVQVDFMRIISGVPNAAHRWSLLREFGANPLHVHWLKLCARFWKRVLDLPPERLLRQALLGDIALFREGNLDCWSAKFLLAMEQLRVFESDHNSFRSEASIVALPITEERVADRAKHHYGAAWRGLPADLVNAASDQIVPATYHHLVCGGRDETGAPHLSTFMPRNLKTCLTRLRVGSFDLRIHTGRFDKTPRHLRTCPACGTGAVEDLAHFALHCPAHAHVRAKFPGMFAPDASLHGLLTHADQHRLAMCLHEMLAGRQQARP